MAAQTQVPSLTSILDSGEAGLFDVRSKARGPAGSLPFTDEMLRNAPSGDLFGWTMNAGMGWDPAKMGGKEILLLSTHGGLRAPDGTPVALGYHSGHWEVSLLVEAAARELKALDAVPFAGYCSDPCDGRSQGTTGMFDSLPFRNDASMVFRRLIRSLPRRSGVLGVATCDKGLPAMMMALAAQRDLATVLIPGGVTLLPEDGEDAAVVGLEVIDIHAQRSGEGPGRLVVEGHVPADVHVAHRVQVLWADGRLAVARQLAHLGRRGQRQGAGQRATRQRSASCHLVPPVSPGQPR